ncbi:hypothetical protein CQW23_03408 [Capsicum baccatum]|uniref:Uncharacterized protein n=1 Tax=Capsicum baccatum TaxID=33114 RepID=A0A2G2XBP0_CAPBA|nr:hypothetical protein CQW23_03408 [Capsicum baccatum]
MPGYAKFMKDLPTKKWAASYESVDDIHHCSAIATRSLVQKKADPGRPFLATRSVLIDMRANELLFRLNDEVVHFDECKSMKQPKDMDVFSIADVYYEVEEELSVEKQCTVEPLSAALLKFERENVEDYEETICALTGIGSYSHVPKQMDLNLTN